MSNIFMNEKYFCHQSAIIDQGATIGNGSHIWHFSHVCAEAIIGNNCSLGQNVFVANRVIVGNNVKIQNNVSLYEGVTLEDDVFCGPSMVFTNVNNPRSHTPRRHEYRNTLVKQGATIGANATIVCGSTIGKHAFIGAGSVVTHDVPDYALVIGVPANIIDYVCICGNRFYSKQAKRISKILHCDVKSVNSTNEILYMSHDNFTLLACKHCGRQYKKYATSQLEG